MEDLQQELDELKNEEQSIDSWLDTMQDTLNDLAHDEAHTKYAYVSFEDIKGLGSVDKQDTNPFLVIQPPKGTTLEVPASESTRASENPYQLFLKSNEGEISVYVVSGQGEELQK